MLDADLTADLVFCVSGLNFASEPILFQVQM